MNINYSYLKDDLALLEIRKHQWIESEKQNKEIGFATAAVDWVKKFGNDFKIARLSQCKAENKFSEKRRYRRFDFHTPVTLQINSEEIDLETKDINLVGMSCRLPKTIEPESETTVTISFMDKTTNKQSKFQFNSTVSRYTCRQSLQGDFCDVFIPFSEDIRNFLRNYSEKLI